MRKYFQFTIFISMIILLLLAHPQGQFVLHLLFMHITSARSPFKILLFIPWLLLSNLSFKAKHWEKIMLVIILPITYVLQIYSLKLLNPDLSLSTYRWHVYESAISSNYLFSVHSNKFISGYISETFLPFLEITADTGWYYSHMLPDWYMVTTLTLIFFTTILLVRQYNAHWSMQKRIAYTIVSFMLLKNVVDGGPFTSEVMVAYPALLYILIQRIHRFMAIYVLTISFLISMTKSWIITSRTIILALFFTGIRYKSFVIILLTIIISMYTPSQSMFVIDQIQYYNTNINTPTNVVTMEPCISTGIYDPLNCTKVITTSTEWKQLIQEQKVPINYRPVLKSCQGQTLHKGLIIGNVTETEFYGKSAFVKIYNVSNQFFYDVQLPRCIPSEISYINMLLQKSVQGPFTSVPLT